MFWPAATVPCASSFVKKVREMDLTLYSCVKMSIMRK
nr:MAG TPA: hypothetical protein [Caudoviricetes sp.]DAS75156.1 MAG TPA: hypothetical protein [Caudoviricetes sp.]